MWLKPLEPPDVALAARWLSLKENYQWLDFGRGQLVGAPILALMNRREVHLLRAYGAHAVQAWAAEANHASLSVLRHNHFRPVGRLRQAHEVGGRRWDRLLFDRLACDPVPAPASSTPSTSA